MSPDIETVLLLRGLDRIYPKPLSFVCTTHFQSDKLHVTCPMYETYSSMVEILMNYMLQFSLLPLNCNHHTLRHRRICIDCLIDQGLIALCLVLHNDGSITQSGRITRWTSDECWDGVCLKRRCGEFHVICSESFLRTTPFRLYSFSVRFLRI